MREHYSILIVDDDSEIVNILQTSLQNAGYQTYMAYNGDEACQLAERLLYTNELSSEVVEADHVILNAK